MRINPYLKDIGRVTLVGAGPGDPELLTVERDQLASPSVIVVGDVMQGQLSRQTTQPMDAAQPAALTRRA